MTTARWTKEGERRGITGLGERVDAGRTGQFRRSLANAWQLIKGEKFSRESALWRKDCGKKSSTKRTDEGLK